MNRAVFLDRDNTIIHNDGDLGDPRQVRLIQGAASAIASLRGLGYKIVVVSNQGGVARGRFTEADVEATNDRIGELVRANSGAFIDRFYYCPYHPQGSVEKYCQEHPWRKPSPGMLRQAAQDLKLDLSHSWMVGDAIRDVEAGAAAGTRTILLHEGEQPPAASERGVEPDFIARSIVEAVRIIAQHRTKTVELLPATEGAAMRPPPAPPDESAATDDAAHAPLSQSATSAGAPGKGQRPWVPWEIQPAGAAPSAAAPPKRPPPPRTPAPEEAPKPAPPAAAPVPVSVASSPPPPSPPSQAAAPPVPAATPATEADATSRDLLQQILRELKSHRAQLGDFAMSKMFAALFQMVAVGCVLFSLFHLAEPVLFLQWFAGAILSQLVVITLLLVHGLK